jgi:hypothetical protein
MFTLFLATDKTNGSIVDFTNRFNKSSDSLKGFMSVSRIRFNRIDVQFQALCLACPYDVINISYYV